MEGVFAWVGVVEARVCPQDHSQQHPSLPGV